MINRIFYKFFRGIELILDIAKLKPNLNTLFGGYKKDMENKYLVYNTQKYFIIMDLLTQET